MLDKQELDFSKKSYLFLKSKTVRRIRKIREISLLFVQEDYSSIHLPRDALCIKSVDVEPRNLVLKYQV